MKIHNLLTLLALLFPAVASAEITGATMCPAGELAIINCDRGAVWTVFPAEYRASFAVSDDGKTLYFASSKKGAVTFIAASVTTDGLPYVENHTLYNGVELPSPPAPTPNDDPSPDTFEGVIRKAMGGLDRTQVDALAGTFLIVVEGIDRGTITSTAGARETFRAVWAETATSISASTFADCRELVTAISERVDNSTVKTLREGYEKAAKVLKDNAPAASVKEPPAEEKTEEEAKEEEPEPPKKPAANSSCPNGQCPNGQCPNVQTGRRFYWIQ